MSAPWRIEDHFPKTAKEVYAMADENKLLREALTDAIATVGRGRVFWMPGATYQPQVSVAAVERWRAALEAGKP